MKKARQIDTSLGSKLFDIFNVVFFIVFSFIMIYPLLYVISVSLSSPEAISTGRVTLLPVEIDFTGYKATMSSMKLWISYYNTVKYSITNTILVLLLCSVAAYPLSLGHFYGKKLITWIFLFTLFFSGGMIPSYLNIIKLGLYDTMWAVVLPTAVPVWYLILMRTNFQRIPSSLRESVEIDGGRSWTILVNVIIPLSKPILATIALFTLVSQWNNFFEPLIYLKSSDKHPLQVYLKHLLDGSSGRLMHSEYTEELGIDSMKQVGQMTQLQMASILVSLGPILLSYPYAQKYFVKGIMVGSIKG